MPSDSIAAQCQSSIAVVAILLPPPTVLIPSPVTRVFSCLDCYVAILCSYLSAGARSLRVYFFGGISVREQATCPISIKQLRKEKQTRHTVFFPAQFFISFSFASNCFLSFIIWKRCALIAFLQSGIDTTSLSRTQTLCSILTRLCMNMCCHHLPGC